MFSRFSSQTSSLCLLTHDNRIHVWDTDSGKEKHTFVERNHLAHKYTCFDWIQISNQSMGYIAVGCSDGIVIIWDLARGVVVTTLSKDNESGAINSIAFSSDATSIFVASNQNSINQYQVNDGQRLKSIKAGKQVVSTLAMNPQADIIAIGSSSVKLVDINSGKKKKLISKFPGGVSLITHSQCGCYLAAAGRGSNEVIVFDIQASATTTPLFVLPTLALPIQLSARSTDSYFEVLALLRGEERAILGRYQLDADDSAIASENVNNSVTNLSVSTISSPSPLISVVLGTAGGLEQSGATAAVGLVSRPTFRHFLIENEKGLLHSTVNLQQINAGSSSSGSSSSSSNGSSSSGSSSSGVKRDEALMLTAPTILGPFESSGGTTRPVTSAGIGEHEEFTQIIQKRSRSDSSVGDDEESHTSVSETNGKKKKKNKSSVSSQTASNELTLEQRLEALAAQAGVLEAKARSKSAADGESDRGGPTASSLVVLVDQALQASDDALLEQCLNSADADTVDATTRLLPVGRVVPLLTRLVAKFEKRPARGALLTQWLAGILMHHASYLISFPGLSSRLGGLGQMLEQRVGTYSRLAALSGRLDLILRQSAPLTSSSSSSSSGRSRMHKTPGNLAPLRIHKDDD